MNTNTTLRKKVQGLIKEIQGLTESIFDLKAALDLKPDHLKEATESYQPMPEAFSQLKVNHFDIGINAYWKGENENPHPFGSAPWKQWASGWAHSYNSDNPSS